MTKITKAHLESIVLQKTFLRPTQTLTLCVVTIPGDAQVVGQSNVIDPANFDAKVGEEMAYEDAIEKMWELEGYALKRQSSSILARAAKAGYEGVRASQAMGDGDPDAVAPKWEDAAPAVRGDSVQQARAVLVDPAADVHPVFRAVVRSFT